MNIAFQIFLAIAAFLAGTRYERWLNRVRQEKEMPYYFTCAQHAFTMRSDNAYAVEEIRKSHLTEHPDHANGA